LLEADATRELITELDQVMHNHAGDTEVYITLVNDAQEERLFALPSRVTVTVELIGELKSLLGKSALI
jgi:DNA polymerase-3 subunit alpha